LQMLKQATKLVLGQPANCIQEGEWHLVPDYGRLLQQVLGGGGQRVDTRSEDRLHCGRDLGAGERPRNSVAGYPPEHGSVDQGSPDLFGEERIPAAALNQEALEGGKAFVRAQQRLKEFPEATLAQWI